MREGAEGRSTVPLQALTVEEVLRASTLEGAAVLAGAAGLDRPVERLNIMEVPDILPWVKPQEFLLTTAYPLREEPEHLVNLVAALDDRGLAGLGIKVGRYLDAVPDDMLDAADRRAFPIVRLPEAVAFDDILHEVLSEILNRQAALLTRSEESHQALLRIIISGGGWPEIARDLARLLDAAVLMIDRDGAVRASGGEPDDDVLAVLRRTGQDTPVGPETAHAGGRGVIDEGGRRLLTVTISASDRDHGRIVAVEQDRPLHPADLQVLENAATVAALVVTTEEAVAAVEGKYAADFLHDLLDGRVGSTDDAAARGATLGWDVARPLAVLVAAPEQVGAGAAPAGLDRIAASIRSVVGARDRGAAVVERTEQVVVLTGAPDDRPTATRLGRRLVDAVRDRTGGSIVVGISRAVDGPAEVGAGYAQAEQALGVGRRLSGQGNVAHFDELGVLRLLALVEDTSELRAYVEETLGPLSGDDAEACELRRTLAVLLEENLNIAASARRLHFHYNTLRYRVDKLERLLGPLTSDPRLRLDVHVALRILDLDELGLAPRNGGPSRS